MATTTNYNFNKPTIGGSQNTWGADLNENWDRVDDILNNVTSDIQPQLDGKASADITISAGDGLTGGGSLDADRTISHADTSSQASVNNSGSNFIQDISVDTYGHVTSIGTGSVSALFPTSIGSYGSSGYIEMPTGLIVNWGRATGIVEGVDTKSISFARSFPSNAIGGIACIERTSAVASGNMGCYIGGLSKTGGTVAIDSDGPSGTYNVFWLVWGR